MREVLEGLEEQIRAGRDGQLLVHGKQPLDVVLVVAFCSPAIDRHVAVGGAHSRGGVDAGYNAGNIVGCRVRRQHSSAVDESQRQVLLAGSHSLRVVAQHEAAARHRRHGQEEQSERDSGEERTEHNSDCRDGDRDGDGERY